MKFGVTLRAHALPEWQEGYINYRLLKKCIRKAVEELQLVEDSGQETLLDEPNLSASPTTSLYESPAAPPPTRRPHKGSRLGADRPAQDVKWVEEVEGDGDDEGLETEVRDGTAPQGTEKDTVRRPSLSPQQPTDTTVKSLTRGRMTFRRQSTLGLFDENKRKRWIYSPDIPFPDLLNLLPPACRKFFTRLDREIDRVEEFYGAREADALRRYAQLAAQWKELANHKKELETYKSSAMKTASILRPIVNPFLRPDDVSKRSGSSRAEDVSSAGGSPGADAEISCPPTFSHGRPEEYFSARSRLKLATTEYYKLISSLKAYAVINHTGIKKALKKYEKATSIPCAAAYASKLDRAGFVASGELDQLIRKTEDGFAAVFEHGDRKAARERLRMLGDEKTHHFTSWRSGMLLGISVPLFLEGVVRSSSSSLPYRNALLQLFGAMGLPVLFSLLFFLNLMCWHRARINYVLIFELDLRSSLDYRQFLALPALLWAIFSLFFWAAFSDLFPATVAPSSYPLAFMIVALVILLAPVNFLHPKARWWMVRSFSRVITAGLVQVEFRDFFLGDELNSLYYTMYNLGFVVCTYQHRWPADVQEICSTNSTWASAVLASLPALWRLGQSIRRYIDSDGLVGLHAVNAGKYACVIAYFLAYFNWRIYGSNHGTSFAIWLLFAVINSCYTITWDTLMDWSLLRRNSKHRFLRPEIGFKNHVWFYYFAIVSNVLLRFTWVIYLPQAPIPSVQLRGFIVALLEVFRRFQWNLLRVESEHIGNVDGYRITRDIALPYTDLYELRPAPNVSDDRDDRPRAQRFFAFCHDLHRSLVQNLAPLIDFDWSSLVKGRQGKRARRPSMSQSKKARERARKDFSKRNETDGDRLEAMADSSAASDDDGVIDSDDDRLEVGSNATDDETLRADLRAAGRIHKARAEGLAGSSKGVHGAL